MWIRLLIFITVLPVSEVHARAALQDSLAAQLEQHLNLANTTNSASVQAEALLASCRLLIWDLQRNTEASEVCARGLHTSQKIRDERLTQSFSRLLGISYANLGILDEAIQHFLIALDIASRREDPLEPVILRNLASVYMEVGDIEQAAFYIDTAIERSDSLTFSLLNTQANLLAARHQFEEALQLYRQAETLALRDHDRQRLSLVNANMSKTLIEIDALDEAGEAAVHAWTYSQELAHPGATLRARVVLCNVLLARGQYEEGIPHCEIALEESEHLGYYRDKLGVHQALSEYFQRKGLAQKAVEHLKVVNEIQQQIQRSAAIERSKQLNSRIELQKQRLENEVLQKNQEKQRLYILAALLILVFAASTSTVLWQYSRKLKKARRQLTDHNEALKTSNTGKDKLFSVMAHDLRNTSVSITGFVEMVHDYLDLNTQPDLHELVQMLERGVRRQNELLTNMLLWSRSQLNAIHLTRKRVHVRDLVNENVTGLMERAAAKSITISVHVPEDMEAFIDPHVFSLVVRNLISNALKFTAKQGQICISARIDETHLTTSVSDTGIGISAAQMKTLFQLDKIESKRGTEDEKGTGLGLILCHEFLQLAGGAISVESEEGVGSTFTFSLPKEHSLQMA